jgi:RND family efflux transporter MFP subunit
MIACATLLAACSRTEPAPEPVRAVRTLLVVAESAGGVAEYAGEVRPRTESRLGFRVGGKIVSRQAELGQPVKAGQILALLDARDLKLAQEGALAAFAAAQANHDQTRADYRRFKELLDKGFISAAELDRRETALKAAQAQLEQARTQAAVQGNQAAYAALVADANGVLTGIEAEPGMVVAPGTPVLRLAHDGPRDVVFAVPEDKIALIKGLSEQAGAFHVKLWGGDGEPLPATIREIAAAADPVTRTFAVKADIGPARAVRLGQTATVLAALPRTEGIAKLPLSALREDQGRSTVWLVDRDSMTVNSRAVQVLGVDGNLVVIGAGIAPGDRVVTAGVHVLNAGQKVKFYVDPDAPRAALASAPAASAPAAK